MFNVIRFLTDYNIPYATSGARITSKYIGIHCPICGNDDDFHCGISKDGKYATCWRHPIASITTLVQSLCNCDYKTAKSIIVKYSDEYSVYSTHPQIQEDGKHASTVEPPGHKLAEKHRAYLESRRFDPDLLEVKYRFTGTDSYEYYRGQDFSNSIIIPVYENGVCTSFQARDCTGIGFHGNPKMRYKGLSKENSVIHYKDSLYNLQYAKSDTVVLVEGVFDAIRGGDGFVCSWGTSLKPRQLYKLHKYRRVFIIFDPEGEAQIKAEKYGVALSSMGIDVEVIDLETGDKDIGDFSIQDICALRKELNLY